MLKNLRMKKCNSKNSTFLFSKTIRKKFRLNQRLFLNINGKKKLQKAKNKRNFWGENFKEKHK